MSYTEKMNRIAQALNSKKLNKWANEVSGVKEAVLDTPSDTIAGQESYPTIKKLSHISKCLEEKGYTLLSKKLKTAMEEYSRLIS